MVSLLIMIRSLKIFVSLFVIFLLHRLQAWSSLSEQFSGRNQSAVADIITGVLSDYWIAAVLTLPFWIFEYTRVKPAKSAQKFLGTLWVIIIGILTAAHQGYVEYFKFQIIPFHLTYLTDPSFVRSNGTSMFQASAALILALSVYLAYWTRKSKILETKRVITVIAMSVLVSAATAHMLNIRWRINWFVIEPLQTNYLEALYSNLGKKPIVKAITSSELDQFHVMTGQMNPLFFDNKNSPEPSIVDSIKSEIKKQRKDGKPLIVALVIAESLREADTGKRASDGVSITPFLDRLQNGGVKFSNVYSSGPVTRGGQESSWCGTPSATDTSLMRSFPDKNISCIPKIFRDDKSVISLWLHGGDERFDSQLVFWTHQGVSRFLTKSDFPTDAPVTGWGVSDLALFDRSVTTIEEAAKSKDVMTVLPMILTVSNHIPWAVPDDASIENKAFIAPHPAHKTIKYFDESLDLFTGSLKEKNLWNNMILIVTGDHGNLESPWRDLYGQDPMRWERMLSHVSMTLSGGIIEKLRRDGQIPAVVDQFTAQEQIAPFILDVIGEKSSRGVMMNRPLFSDDAWPVMSDLNQYLFMPKSGVKIPKESVLAGKTPEDPKEPWLASIRYRSWLEFLYSGKQAKESK